MAQGTKSEMMTISSPAVSEHIQFNVLMKFIKSFDGDKHKLSPFIKNCENAISLASDSQKELLFKFILSQLEGKAELACSLKVFENWQDLKSFLKTTFGETKHRDHLLLDLQNCKYKASETVSQYSLRLETYLTRLQTDIAHSTKDSSELKGRIANTEDLALHTFLLGLPNHISSIVRCRNPSTLNDAISLAIQEEKMYNYMQTTKTIEPRPIKCKICGKLGHSERSCFHNRRPIHSLSQTPNPKPSTSNSSQGLNTNVVTCRYCKNIGHDISECRKRQYNNNARQRQQPNSSHYSNKVYNFDVCEDDVINESIPNLN